VIGELDSGIVRGLTRVVEDLREVLPVVQRLAPFRGNEWHDDVLVPDRLGRVERRLPLIVALERDVRGGGRESVSVEDRLHIGRRMIVVAGELDLLVADLRDAGDGPLKIRFHLIAYGVQLQANLLQACAVPEACAVRRAQCAGTRDGGQCLYELPSITAHAFHSSLLFIASTA